jgi:hypothetical protein
VTKQKECQQPNQYNGGMTARGRAPPSRR